LSDFNWKEHFDLSQEFRCRISLIVNEEEIDEESCFRTYISRICMSMFCVLRDKIGLTGKSDEVYKNIRDYLKRLGLHDIDDKLWQLRKLRNLADYGNDSISYIEGVADEALGHSNYIDGELSRVKPR